MRKLSNLCVCVVVAFAGCQSIGDFGRGGHCNSASCTECASGIGCGKASGNWFQNYCGGCSSVASKLCPFGRGYSGCMDEFHGKHSAKSQARSALRQLRRETGQRFSSEFEDGFETAFVDIAMGGTGDIPVVPPAKYWNRSYRTAAGHARVNEWFDGYRVASNQVRTVGVYDENTVAAANFSEDSQAVAQHDIQPEPALPYAPAPAPSIDPEVTLQVPTHDPNELLLSRGTESQAARSVQLADIVEGHDPKTLRHERRLPPRPEPAEQGDSDQAGSIDYKALREKLSSLKPKAPSMPSSLPSFADALPDMRGKMPSFKPSIPSMPMPKLKKPSMPSFPSMPSIPTPSLPSIPKPSMPSFKKPSLPSFKLPKVSGVDVDSL